MPGFPEAPTCEKEDVAHRPIEPLVVGTGPEAIIEAVYRHVRPAVLAAIGSELVEEAEGMLDLHISNAAYRLRGFGIDADLLRGWVHEQLEKRHGA